MIFFFFNDTATTEIYTLSLHDALPICPDRIGEPSLLELAPQVVDVDVDDVRGGLERLAPDLLAQLVAREHLPAVSHEVLEQRELGARQGDLAALDRDLARGAVEHERPRPQHLRRRRRPPPRQRA